MLAGTYHFARADIIATTQNSGGIANTGTDEADHMIQMAGPWMRPGYLLPVLDLEAGNTQRTTAELSSFAVAFSDRIFQQMGIRAMIYANSSYVNSEVNSTVPAAMPKPVDRASHFRRSSHDRTAARASDLSECVWCLESILSHHPDSAAVEVLAIQGRHRAQWL
jgi:hypothetical protein